ncbi:hypothetical protein ACWJJH_04130 [Endozoicomonadaceae bacterium StTr2]
MQFEVSPELMEATTLITGHLPQEQWLLQGTSRYSFDQTTEEERSGERFCRKAARNYFSGFVLRGDTRPKELIFSQGFQLRQGFSESERDISWRIAKAMGVERRVSNTGSEGISTTCRYQTARVFSERAPVFLIDGRGMWGVIIEHSGDQREDPPYVEVNYLHSIPPYAVLGVLPDGVKNMLTANANYKGLDSEFAGDFTTVRRWLNGSMPCQTRARNLRDFPEWDIIEPGESS